MSKRNDHLAYRAARSVAKMTEAMSALELPVPELGNSYDLLIQSLHPLERAAADFAKIREQWVSQIRPYYILDMMGLGTTIEKFRRVVESLRLFTQKSGLILRDIQTIIRKNHDLNNANEQVKSLERIRMELESASAKARAKLEALSSERAVLMKTPLMAEIAKTDEELRNLRARMVELAFRRLVRPLKKLDSATERGEYALDLETRTALQQYIQKPFTTFVRESPEIPQLKTILTKLRDATIKRRISIKVPERRKIEEKFQLIVQHDSLSEIYKFSRVLISRRRELTSSPSATDAIEKYRAMLRSERSLTRALTEKGKELALRQRELAEMQARCQSIRNEIEEMTKSLTGRRIELAA